MTDVYRAVSSIIVRRLPLNESAKILENSTLKSIARKPTETVYLLVQKPRKHHAWQFPQGGQDKGEKAVDAAFRELKEECGSDLKVKIIDNAPIGQYMYKFPKNFNRWDDSIGAQVSFFRADYCEGQCCPDGKEIVDFAWLSKEELQNYIHPEYKKAVDLFLE